MIAFIVASTFLQLALGSCTSNKECNTGCCQNSVCSDSSSCFYNIYGVYCTAHHYCLSGYCSSNHCDVRLQNRCSTHGSCLSGCCYKGYCVPLTYCSILKEEGDVCTCDCDCREYICFKNYCDKKSSGLKPYKEKCFFNSDCISGCCNFTEVSGYCIQNNSCKNYENSEKCSTNTDCKSGFCIGEVCKQNIEYTTPAALFVFIGLPIIGLGLIGGGILIMLKCFARKLVSSMKILNSLEPPKNLTTVSVTENVSPTQDAIIDNN